MVTKELHKSLTKALGKMEEALTFPKTEPMREATIHRFEYTFELSWKLMSSILKDQNREEYGVKNIIRAAARLGLLESEKEVKMWFDFASARNQTVHIYREDVAKEVYKVATGKFVPAVKKLLGKAKEYI